MIANLFDYDKSKQETVNMRVDLSTVEGQEKFNNYMLMRKFCNRMEKGEID